MNDETGTAPMTDSQAAYLRSLEIDKAAAEARADQLQKLLTEEQAATDDSATQRYRAEKLQQKVETAEGRADQLQREVTFHKETSDAYAFDYGQQRDRADQLQRELDMARDWWPDGKHVVERAERELALRNAAEAALRQIAENIPAYVGATDSLNYVDEAIKRRDIARAALAGETSAPDEVQRLRTLIAQQLTPLDVAVTHIQIIRRKGDDYTEQERDNVAAIVEQHIGEARKALFDALKEKP